MIPRDGEFFHIKGTIAARTTPPEVNLQSCYCPVLEYNEYPTKIEKRGGIKKGTSTVSAKTKHYEQS